MAKLLLIHPATRTRGLGLGDTESLGMPPISLGYVAALTPDDWEIKIVDEYVETLDLNQDADLVGITSTTSTAMRAYEICEHFRKRNIKTIMGGVHTSLIPDEVTKYADAVVVGEAENVWDKVIKDFKNKKLKKKYEGEKSMLVDQPVPRRDLYSDKYVMDTMQTTRGCPFSCEYCCISVMYGTRYRARPVKDVLDEMQTIRKKMLYFIDDNFFGIGEKGEQRTVELCKGIVERGIKKYWGTQASLNIAEYPEALKWAYKSGCRCVYVGIESIFPDTLKQLNKVVNYKLKIEGMKQAIRKIQKYGISVVGAFIFGNDNDDNSVFHTTLDFMLHSGLNAVQIGILTPYPGTEIRVRMEKEKRLIIKSIPEDWDRYDTENINYIPKNISIIDLVRGYDYVAHSLFCRKNIRRWKWGTLLRTKSIVSTIISHSLNNDAIELYDFRKKFRKAAEDKLKKAEK